MKINEKNQMSFVKLKLSVILDRAQLEIIWVSLAIPPE